MCIAPPDSISIQARQLVLQEKSPERALDGRADRFVVDRTGLTGTYNFDLRFGRPDVQGGAGQDSDLPIIFTALQEQLGLKLESERGPVEFLVIDRVEARRRTEVSVSATMVS